MSAIALAIVWYSIITDEDFKTAPQNVKNIAGSIASVALVLIFIFAIRDAFR